MGHRGTDETLLSHMALSKEYRNPSSSMVIYQNLHLAEAILAEYKR